MSKLELESIVNSLGLPTEAMLALNGLLSMCNSCRSLLVEAFRRATWGRRFLGLILMGVFSLPHTGCVTMEAFMGKPRTPSLDISLLQAQGYQIPPGGMPSPVEPAADGKPRVVLEVRDDGRHLESIPLPVDRALFVEDIVQEASLHKRFGHLAISIMRPMGEGQPPTRLDARTDDDGKVTSLGQNYALQPGDHLVVNVDQRTSLERFVDRQFKK
ncbi:hypothetical protein Q31a_62520 [Aureliella helgolandensis]|uniref:Uncharacterized protein n=2 Tax=Aureliella helgolandensis TaxID=2527968 RepID=A0A518GGY9_9BACT|nr:hypothetical protein Q31a_62520 [Aureliella helgolandensis]